MVVKFPFLKQAFVLLLLLSLGACKIVKGLRELKKTKAQEYHYRLGDKELVFIPMHHLGKAEFYQDVKGKVAAYKKQGYIVFYELISTQFEADSVTRDHIRRKARKIKGFSGTYKDAANESKLLKKYVQQPSYKELGIDDKDVRADVNYLQFMNEWEKQNGEVKLDSMDLHTPFDAKYQKGSFYTKKQYNNIVIHYRNQHLSELIKNSAQNKILILYGEGHRKDFRAQLHL